MTDKHEADEYIVESEPFQSFSLEGDRFKPHRSYPTREGARRHFDMIVRKEKGGDIDEDKKALAVKDQLDVVDYLCTHFHEDGEAYFRYKMNELDWNLGGDDPYAAIKAVMKICLIDHVHGIINLTANGTTEDDALEIAAMLDSPHSVDIVSVEALRERMHPTPIIGTGNVTIIDNGWNFLSDVLNFLMNEAKPVDVFFSWQFCRARYNQELYDMGMDICNVYDSEMMAGMLVAVMDNASIDDLQRP